MIHEIKRKSELPFCIWKVITGEVSVEPSHGFVTLVVEEELINKPSTAEALRHACGITEFQLDRFLEG